MMQSREGRNTRCLREHIALCSDRNEFKQHALEDCFADTTADMFTP
jgi:uncharacterized membrane protein